MSSACRASKPAAFIAETRRSARADLVRSGSPIRKTRPAVCRTTPGAGTSAAACTTHPRMCLGANASKSVPAGSRQATGWPSKRPPSPWKYHHGRPLIAGTTTVSGPTSVFSRGSIAPIECVLRHTKTVSWAPNSHGSSEARRGKIARLPPARSVRPFARKASRCAPRATAHTSCPARANPATTRPPIAPAPTTQTFTSISWFQRLRREDEIPDRADLLVAHQPGRVADSGELDELDARSAFVHPPGGRLRQQVGLRSAQDEGRALHRIPDLPEVDAEEEIAAEFDARVAAAHRADDGRVVG